MQQIYTAVNLYKQDEKRYPSSIAALLPRDALLDNTSAATAVNGQNCTTGDDTCPNARGTGYLKSTGNLICPNENRDTKVGISSYGDISTDIAKPSPTTITSDNMGRYVWDYWGYKTDGTAYLTSADAATDLTAATKTRLVYPDATTAACATARVLRRAVEPDQRFDVEPLCADLDDHRALRLSPLPDFGLRRRRYL